MMTSVLRSVAALAFATSAASVIVPHAQTRTSKALPDRPKGVDAPLADFDVLEKTILELQEAMQAGRVRSKRHGVRINEGG